MDNTLKDIVRTKIALLKELRFQAFVDNLYLICHGDDFVVVKQKHDKGSDGVLFNNHIIACYAPENYSLSDFKKKVSGDYKSYSRNWEKTHPNWSVVYNGVFVANMIQHVDLLKDGAGKIGIDNLINKIAEQNWTRRNKVFEYLGIGSEYTKHDIIEEAIKDIIQYAEMESYRRTESPISPTEKIELNYTEDEIEDAVSEFEDYLLNASFISDVLQNYNEQYPILLNKVKSDFSELDKMMTFKARLAIMIRQYSEKAKKQDDDIYVYYVKMLMLYCFEQCVIGKKSKLC